MSPALPSYRRRGFSLIEILVAITLLTVIMAALTVMFGEVKRAFRRGSSQNDVLDGARATMLLLSQRIQEMIPSQSPSELNFYALPAPSSSPLSMTLPGGQVQPYWLQDIYVLSRSDDNWRAIKFALETDAPSASVATLYLLDYQTSTNLSWLALQELDSANIRNISVTNKVLFRRVMDGVVHLRVLAYDTNGSLITNRWANPDGEVIIDSQPDGRGGYSYKFSNTAVPASVDLELGILEPQALAQFKAIASVNTLTAYNWITNRAGRIHLFRQRIPIHAENRIVP